jgi:CheY-like chemotaxis protein
VLEEDKRAIHLHGTKILLVEDNEFNRLLANKILTDAGAELVECANGQEAIVQCCKESFDLILMDMQMPVMGGVESAFLLLNGVKIAAPIVALTANAIKGEKDKCLEAGMVDFVSKPFEEEHLLRVCAKWTKAKDAKDQMSSSSFEKSYNRGFDLSKLNRIANGNKEFVMKLLQIFIKDAEERSDALKSAIVVKNCDEIYAIAHKLKPGIDDLGIEDLKSVVRDVEHLAGKKMYCNDLITLVEKLSNGLREIAKAIRHDQGL